MDFNEQDKAYIEQAESIDNVMMFKEIKKLNDKLDSLNSKVEPKTDQERRSEILAIKDTNKRLNAIRENLYLFQDRLNSRKIGR